MMIVMTGGAGLDRGSGRERHRSLVAGHAGARSVGFVGEGHAPGPGRALLHPHAEAASVGSTITGSLMPVWGRPVELPEPPPEPRTFPASGAGPRRVAESLEMAGEDPMLSALFRVHGVAEAIAEDGAVRVRAGRLFDWDHVQPRVVAALAGPGEPPTR